MSVVIGIISFVGILFLLRGHLYGLILGMLLLGNSVNLTIFNASKPQVAKPSFVSEGGVSPASSNDPLSQALVLTAIVIGFALLTYLVALVEKLTMGEKVQHLDEMCEEAQGE